MKRRWQQLPLLLGLVLIVNGCSLHTPIQPTPLDPVPERYSRQLSIEELGLDQPWWQVYGDTQLDGVVEWALQSNQDVEQALARIRQNDARRRAVAANQWPSVTAEAEVQRQRTLSDITGETRGFSAASTWEIDLWGKLASRSTAAELRSQASVEELRGVFVGLSAQVADAYFLWQEQTAQLALAEQTASSNADSLARVERRYLAGLTGPLDVYQARQNLATAQAAKASRQQLVVEAASLIDLLMGQFRAEQPSLYPQPLPRIRVPWTAGLSAELLLQRPDVKAAAFQLRAADRELAAAIADRLPSLSVGGSVGQNRSDLSGVTLSGLVWNLFANLSAPLVDGGRRRAEVDRNQAQVDEALAAYRQSLLAAAKEIEDAQSAEVQTRQRVARLEEEAAAADAALRLATDNYFQGLSDYLEVLSAQRFQFDARSRLLLSRRELVGAQVTLARSLGGSWLRVALEKRSGTVLPQGD